MTEKKKLQHAWGNNKCIHNFNIQALKKTKNEKLKDLGVGEQEIHTQF